MKHSTHLAVFIVLVLFCQIPTWAQQNHVFNALNYGAVGNGQTDDSPAIQKAINACRAAGGGQVLLPGGHTYLSSPLTLTGNLDFHIQTAAVLKATTNAQAYGTPPAFLLAKDANHLTLSGHGTIDGQGLTWMNELVDDIFRAKPGRPGLVFFEHCNQLTIQDVTFVMAPAWTVHLIGCEDVLVEGIRILNDRRIPNCDGIDPNHCRNVRIANCHIEAGDDCIVAKNTRDYVQYGPTENITVTGCTLASSSCAIKIGTESHSDFRRLIFENCVIYDSNRGLGIQLRDQGNVEDVLFANITIETHLHGPSWWGKAEPIYVTAIPRTADTQLGTIRNVRFSNIICKSENSLFIHGWHEGHIEHVTLDNVQLTCDKWTPRPGGQYDTRPGIGPGVYKTNMAAIYLSHAKDLTLTRLPRNLGQKQTRLSLQSFEHPACHGLYQ